MAIFEGKAKLLPCFPELTLLNCFATLVISENYSKALRELCGVVCLICEMLSNPFEVALCKLVIVHLEFDLDKVQMEKEYRIHTVIWGRIRCALLHFSDKRLN